MEAEITVKVTNLDGDPVANENVRIKACTVPSNPTILDGHEGHDRRNDACRIGRPAPFLENNAGVLAAQPVRNNLVQGVVRDTDANGEITITYQSPKHVTQARTTIFISGQDDVRAELTGDTKFYASLSITTRVLDTGNNNASLQPMPNSQPDTCPRGNAVSYPPAGNYFFEKQGSHDCIFYGTLQTDQAVAAIAADFANTQVQCSRNDYDTNPLCLVDEDTGNSERPVQITGNPRDMKITAMGLTWEDYPI